MPPQVRAAGLADFVESERMDGQLLSATFVELTDTMVADFDLIDFLHVLTTRSV